MGDPSELELRCGASMAPVHPPLSTSCSDDSTQPAPSVLFSELLGSDDGTVSRQSLIEISGEAVEIWEYRRVGYPHHAKVRSHFIPCRSLY